MKIYEKRSKTNAKTSVYFFGIKIFSYKTKNVVNPETLQYIKDCQEKYQTIEQGIRSVAMSGSVVNIAFVVITPSMFPGRPLLKALANNQRFRVNVIVIPDLRYGLENARKIQHEAVEAVAKLGYSPTVAPIDLQDDDVDLRLLADVLFLPMPYDVSHEKYNLKNIINLGILPAMINYGFFRSIYDREFLIARPMYSFYWKVYVETEYNLREFKNHSLISGCNTVLVGYCKMDEYQEGGAKDGKRKTVLIAPHHSVEGSYNEILGLSNFLKYAEFFSRLPDSYPQLDFIFRPHPSLFLQLSDENYWGKLKVAAYIKNLKSKTNLVYSDTAEYFDDFSSSDAMIQDCGSYLVEYLYTFKPQCYMLKSPEDIGAKFVELGQKCLGHNYISYNEDQIINFIENNIIAGYDPKKNGREIFAKEEVMINHPNVAGAIVLHLENLFFGEV